MQVRAILKDQERPGYGASDVVADFSQAYRERTERGPVIGLPAQA